MPNCSFCSRPIEPGTGSAVIQKTGRIAYFCSSKCAKSASLGRDPRKCGWVRKAKSSKSAF